MSTRTDRRIEPSDLSPEILRQLDDLVHAEGAAALVGPDGERVDLPRELHDLLLFVVDSMKRKQAVYLIPEDEAFTTQAAAQYLGMSRPYLLRLLDQGRIPFHRVGTHRRIMYRDLRAFQTERDRERRQSLDALTQAIDRAGVYDRY
jgi:excisionase family DNA binding protein